MPVQSKDYGSILYNHYLWCLDQGRDTSWWHKLQAPSFKHQASSTKSLDKHQAVGYSRIITDGNDIYDIEWITYQDGRYKAARLLVAGGGPNIWVNMHTHEVEGYWASDRVIEPFIDNIGLDEYLEELHANK